MPAPPLTHHDILALAAPFARAGWQVDLAASERAARRIAFRSIERAATDAAPALRDSLQLESFGTGTCRLTRSLTMLEGGLRATLQVLGPDPAVMLEQVLGVEPRRAFVRGPGYLIACSYELYPRSHPSGAEPVLLRGEVRLEDRLTLRLALSAVKGVAGELALEPGAGGKPRLPQDLLAVLGWQWARMIDTPSGWRSKLRLRGDVLRRSRGAERALEMAAQHLARTLAEPPARFHERWRVARWGVALRRALPLLTVIAMLVIAPLLPRDEIARYPALVTLLFQLPIALVAVSFAVQELAQFEIPPLPRRNDADSWWQR